MSFDNPPAYQTMDEAYIAQCLQLAGLGDGFVSPNPMVGAVVLDANGRVVGRGYHPKVGEGHAEVFALNQAGERAKDGTIYVSLEPCNHQGRTPPCTQKIIDAGISRVVCGTLDPNPLVSGSGRDRLQNERISVRSGFLEAECERLNESFFYHIRHQMPFVTIKLALSMDGKIANRHGDSKWLTGALSRQVVHQMRQRVDAIVTTAETVLADDPSLTVRDIPNIRRQPGKVVFDRLGKLKPSHHKLFEGDALLTWVVSEQVFTRVEHDLEKAKKTGHVDAKTKVQIIAVPNIGGHLDLHAAFKKLYQNGLANLLVESGGQFASALLDQKLAQKLYLFYAPKLLRDSMAKPAFSQTFSLDFPQCPQLKLLKTHSMDEDWLIEAQPVAKKIKTEKLLFKKDDIEQASLKMTHEESTTKNPA